MSLAVYSPDARTVADVRRLEIGQLLRAFEALHVEGIIDRHEYHAKRLTLTDGSHVDD